MRQTEVRLVSSALCLLLKAAFASTPLQAQEGPDPGRAILDTEAALEVLEREANCITDKRRRLEETVRLLREALVQHNRSASGSAERQAARDAVRSLVQRRRAILQQVAGCRQQIPVESGPPQGQVVRTAQPSAAERRVGERGDAVEVLEQDTLLVSNVHAVRGERVDGSGRLSGNAARSAIRSVAPAMARCYDRENGHGALRRGRAIVSFTINTLGRVSRVRVEQNTLGARFGSCLTRAARSIRTQAPSGGDVTYAYTLSFPD